MSSALRLSIVMVLLLATAALGFIAYTAYLPKPDAPTAQNGPGPPAGGYIVAAHPLRVGTLARDEDFEFRTAPSGGAPAGAILDTPDARAGLRGSLVRNSSRSAVPSPPRMSCNRATGASSPACSPRTAAPSASTSTRSPASRA